MKDENVDKDFLEFSKNTDLMDEAIKISTLVQKAYDDGYVGHLSVSRALKLNTEKFAMAVINIGWNGTTTKDNEIAMDFKFVHKAGVHFSAAYALMSRLGEAGIILYKDDEINQILGFLSKVDNKENN